MAYYYARIRTFLFQSLAITGEGYDLGEEAGAWFSRFLDKEGCRLGYMAPWNKPRLLVDDLRWQDITHVEDQVIMLWLKK